MSAENYLGFLVVALVLAVTPGPDTVLALRYAVVARRAGLLAATGTAMAILVWAALVAVGVAALLRASDLAYGLLGVAGGCYLLFLGCRAIIGARREARTEALVAVDGGTLPRSKGSGSTAALPRGQLQAGVGTCLTNPKTGLFFIALFPQFTPAGANPLFVTLVLGGTIAVVVYAYLITIVILVDGARRWLMKPRVARAIETVSGGVLGGLGVVMIVSAAIEFTHA